MNNVTLLNCCRVGGDKQRNPHCIRSSVTVCDLSSSLTDWNAYYTADVLSEPPLGVTTDLIEFPHTSSPRFCPYKDSKFFCCNELDFFFLHKVLEITFHLCSAVRRSYKLFRCMFRQVSSGKELIHTFNWHTLTASEGGVMSSVLTFFKGLFQFLTR